MIKNSKMQLLKIIITIQLLTVTVLGWTQENEWVHKSPNGADVMDIAIDPVHPERIIAAGGTPYLRTAADQPWAVLDNLSNLAPNGITSIESTSEGIFLAGSFETPGVIYKSIDGGLTWQEKPLSVFNGILNIIIDPVDANTIYATTTSNNAATVNEIIFKSTDSGETWTPFDMTAALPVGLQCTDLAIDPDNNQILIALGDGNFSYDAKVVRSDDGGITWTDITNTLPVGTALNDVKINNGSIFISGGHHFSGNFGVYKSEDDGNSWEELSIDFPLKIVNDLAIDPSDSNKMFVATEGAGIYTTVDGGQNWDFNSDAAAFNGACRQLIFSPDGNNKILSAYIGIGVAKTENAGTSWSVESEGMNELYLTDVEVAPDNSGIVLASYEGLNTGGCFIYDPNSDTWQPAGNLPAPRFSQVSIGSDGAMYAWSLGPTKVAQDGLYKSTDGGITWENKGPDVGMYLETEIFGLSVSNSNPDLIFIAGNNFGVNGWGSVIYRSTDGGNTWEDVYSGEDFESFRFIQIDPNSNDIIYAVYKNTSSGAGLVKSIDGGNTWQIINNGIASTAKWASCIITDPNNADVLYAGVGGASGIARTIYKSVDQGVTWTNTFLPPGENLSKITDIIIDPLNSNLIYVATNKDGVFMSENGADSWEIANEGLSAQNITGISSTYEDENGITGFYISTYGNGLFRQTLNSSTVAVEHYREEVNITVYPNPAAQNVNFLSTDKLEVVEVKVYTTNGILAQAFQFKNSEIEPQINISDLSEGLYILEIITKNRMVSRKKLLISK